MDVKSITKRISTVGVAFSFVVLTACGGSSSSSSTTAASGTEPVSAATIAAAQAELDALASVSPFDYAAVATARTSCIVSGNVINTAGEIACYQAFLETIAPVS